MVIRALPAKNRLFRLCNVKVSLSPQCSSSRWCKCKICSLRRLSIAIVSIFRKKLHPCKKYLNNFDKIVYIPLFSKFLHQYTCAFIKLAQAFCISCFSLAGYTSSTSVPYILSLSSSRLLLSLFKITAFSTWPHPLFQQHQLALGTPRLFAICTKVTPCHSESVSANE
jgi:hypothetical protein